MSTTDVIDLPDIEPVPAEDLVRSLTGWDEIAISERFRKEFSDLGQTITMRSLVFVQLRRAKVPDGDAFRACMNLPLGDLERYFVNPQEAQEMTGADLDAVLDGGGRPEASSPAGNDGGPSSS